MSFLYYPEQSQKAHSHLQTLLEVPDVGLLCLQQLGHDEPEAGRQR